MRRYKEQSEHERFEYDAHKWYKSIEEIPTEVLLRYYESRLNMEGVHEALKKAYNELKRRKAI